MVQIIKFSHILLTIALLGSIFFCLALLVSKKFALTNLSHQNRIVRLNKIILLLAFFAMLTGTFLVYPKHFTFRTPWIQAAYFFSLLFGIFVSFLIFFRNKIKRRWYWLSVYLFLSVILLGIIHDAVTKTTFL